MDDLISRQAAIDEAKKLLDYYGTNDITKEFADLAAEQFMNRVPSAQPEVLAHGEGELFAQSERWIPCSERLPTTKDDYIITVKDKSLTWTDYVEWSADYHWWEYDDDMVIAWMPLPEPYKGEES